MKPLLREEFLIWLFALWGLLAVTISQSRRVHLPFLAGLLVFSFLTVCPGFYFRGHYFILFLPAVAIAAGVGFDCFSKIPVFSTGMAPRYFRRPFIILAGLAVIGFSLYPQRWHLFKYTPTQACLYHYGQEPFVYSVQVAEYVKENSSPDDTILVLGSEPQIYFYSQRRCATRYIYVFHLMDNNQYVAAMQNEFTNEIESTEPKFLIIVYMQSSWTYRTGFTLSVIDRINSYSAKYYEPVGVVDILADRPPIYLWGEQVIDYAVKSDKWIVVYKRKTVQ
jgi:hypothetical protein